MLPVFLDEIRQAKSTLTKRQVEENLDSFPMLPVYEKIYNKSRSNATRRQTEEAGQSSNVVKTAR